MSFRPIQSQFLIIFYCSIRLFATVTTARGALIIGGYDDESSVATVACYNSGWGRFDDLQSVRHDHRAISMGEKIFVVGGRWGSQ